MNDREIILTHHAIARLAELRFSREEGKKKLQSARRLKRKLRREFYKACKYGNKQSDVDFYYHNPLLFTICDQEQMRNGEKIRVRVVITVTKRGKKGLLKYEKLV